MVSMEINDNLLNVARLHEETIFYIILLIDRLKQKGKIWLCTKKWRKESKVLDRAQTTNSFPPLSKDVSLNSINLMAPQFPALRSSNRVPLISPPPFLPPFHQLHFHHGLEINVRIDQKRKRNLPNNLVFNSSAFVIPNLRCISAIFISFEQFLSYLETTHCAYAWNLILVIYIIHYPLI